MYVSRTNQEYLDGVAAFLAAVEEDRLEKDVEFIYCACCDCINEISFLRQNVALQIKCT